jgi:hypothetical protein
MDNSRGKQMLLQLKQKWVFKALLIHLLIATSLSIIATVLVYKIYSASLLWSLPFLVTVFLITMLVYKNWKLTEWDVSRFLNVTKPTLEESTDLLLTPTASLNFLEQLQARKVETELAALVPPDPFKRQFTTSLIVLLVAIIVGGILWQAPLNSSHLNTSATPNSPINYISEIILPEIKNTNLIVTPPAYTGKTARQQNRFNVVAEEGAIVSWQITTNVAAKKVKLIFNNGFVLSLNTDNKHLVWRTQKVIKGPGFYQVKVNNKLSELYKIESVKDQPPTITLQSPPPSTTINYGEPERVAAKVTLADDYSITAANISATISSGQGEAVKFKEQKLVFENFAAGRREYQLQKLIDCKALGMQPGDELYFFITAVDNHKQETRSEVYIVTLQDTTDFMSMDGMATSLDIKPELFRSQRQIIIETEQLIKDKTTITPEAFKNKSNDLGTDQKLLRLRYGKFLGEETDNEIGGDYHDEHDHEKSNTENANKILDQYSHKHDNTEDATFFDAATKKQLKATLNEMWSAELKLRTFLPKEALPFEYKALKLLKDLQQKSRAYVPKTGFKSTPLKLDKRLTGDLTKINQPVTKQSIQKPEATATNTRRALGILEQLKASGEIDASSKEMLQQAFHQLSIRAANQPSMYLLSLSALRKVLNENFRVRDIKNAEQGLQKMVAPPDKLPYPTGNAAMNLSKHYFLNLNKGNR